jgi:putative transposase
MLIQQITYKATMSGIQVEVVEESYTSGTSYVDNEEPIKANYDKTRRKKRGLFVSNEGIEINADVNGSYQIMKKAKIKPPIKYQEKVVRVKVA